MSVKNPNSKQMSKGPAIDKQSPEGISPEDWADTPASVRELVLSLVRTATPQNHLHFAVLLFFNLAIVVVISLYLRDKTILPCVRPVEVSAASAGIILLIFIHLLWHTFRPLIHSDGQVQIGRIALPIRWLLVILDELHPWKLSTPWLWALATALLLIILFANLNSLSPFRSSGEKPFVQGFLVQGLEGETKTLNPGDVLNIPPRVNYIIEAKIHSESEASCTWSIASRNAFVGKGCSIIFSLPFETPRDSLMVLVQSTCSTGQTYAGFHVVEEQPVP